MSQNKGLGRGLDILFDQNLDVMNDDKQVVDIELVDIEPNPFQPRKYFDEESLQELAESIRIQGVLQPILVRQAIIGYEIISGERRYRASKLAGFDTIPAIIYEYDDKQMMEVGIIENIQREDLSIVEEAKSYQTLIDNLQMTQAEVSKRVGKSRPHIANMLRVLKLDEQILDLIENNHITMGHAKVLVSMEDNDRAVDIAKKAAADDLSVREVERMAKAEKDASQNVSKKDPDKKSNEYLRLEQVMREKLDASVKISGKKRGKISIEFESREDLERIIEELNIF